MKEVFRNKFSSFLITLFILSLTFFIQSNCSDDETSKSKGFNTTSAVFPGAVGFGVQTSAGKSGAILRVTNLNSEGAGSLRKALNTKGARIIVFEVGGVIDVDKNNIIIAEPFLTVAGQTAPSPGITIIRGGISIRTHDVLIQHIRVRPGDAGEAKKSGWEPDGISTSGGEAYNIVIDHCSVSWAVDENLSASGPRTEGPEATSHKITFSNCIIAEGLDNSSHSKGPHSKGSLIHDFCTEIAVIANLYAHNVQRNPYFKAFTSGVIINNVIYNPESSAIKLNYVNSEWENANIDPENGKVAIVGNVLIHGSDTIDKLALVASRGDAYLEDNLALDRYEKSVDITSGEITALEEKPVWPQNLRPLPANELVNYIAEHAGARPNDRDSIDSRIIADFLNKKGRIIDSQEDVGGYPDLAKTTRKLEIPKENINEWLYNFSRGLE